MHRIIPGVLVVTIYIGAISCSGTSRMTESHISGQKVEVNTSSDTPTWFSGEGVEDTADTVSASGAAIAVNSERAISAASDQATLLLKEAIGDKLESFRAQASAELGKDAGLDNPEFLFFFQKAADAVKMVTEVRKEATKTINTGNGVRGFSTVQLSKQQLIERIDNLLADHEQSWNALKKSRAFQDF